MNFLNKNLEFVDTKILLYISVNLWNFSFIVTTKSNL